MKLIDYILIVLDGLYTFVNATYLFIRGFRLSDWELSQIIISDVRQFQSPNIKDINESQRLMLATQIYAHAFHLGLFHFVRGLRYACKRDPSLQPHVVAALQVMIESCPVGLNERNCTDYFYVVDQFKTFYKILPATSERRSLP